jgi:aspartate racemase
VLYNLNRNEIHALQLSGRWDQITDILSEAATKLRSAGAQAVMFCANTPHKVYADVSRKTGTMEDGFMQQWLREHYQVEVVVPTSAAIRTELHRIIQKELGMGIFKPETKRAMYLSKSKSSGNEARRESFWGARRFR